MNVFRIFFTLLMILFPVAFSWLYRPRGEDVDRDRLRKRRVRLHLATGVAVIVTLVLWIGANADWFAVWAELPRFMTWSETPAELAWLLFFPLWFGFAMPVIVAARPEMVGPHPAKAATRTASLAPRSETATVPRARWIAGWTIWIAGLVVVGIGGLAGGAPARTLLAAFFLVGGGLPPLLVTPWALRRLPQEPEPLDPAGSPELLDAYARHREAKARGFAGMAIGMAGLFTAIAVAVVAWPERPEVVGIAGGVGGTVIGLCGAIFGIRMSGEREKIRRMLDELSATEAGH